MNSKKDSINRFDADIVGLNNRLARYIDTVRQLELKKGNLKKKLTKVEEIRNSELEEGDKESTNVLNELKCRLEQEKKEMKKAKKSCEKEVQENMRLVGLIQKQNKHTDILTRKHDDINKQVNEQISGLRDVEQENEKDCHEVFRLRDNISKCSDKIESLTIDETEEQKKNQDAKTILDILRKERNDRKRNISETRKETTKRKYRQETEGDLDIEQHFQKCLKELRNKAVNEMKDDLESIEKFQNMKVQQLEYELCSEIGENKKIKENLTDMNKKKEDYTRKIKLLGGKCVNLEKDITSLEKIIQMQEKEQIEESLQKEIKTSDLKEKLEHLKSTHRRLIAEKVGLDLEITAYMKMMELEEERIKETD